jgi:hypothetical protein
MAAAAKAVRNTEGAVTYAQWALIVRSFCEIAGVEHPQTRGEADALIKQLLPQREAVAAKVAEVPF